jgi:acetolactate synthase-1/2/3 large subunit
MMNGGMNGADLLVRTLKGHGVEWIATLCGHGLDPLFQAARSGGLRLVDTRNEQTAAYIADAYGRLTRKAGVCAVSSGVAHVNALAGVANAWFDGAPMLLISGAAAAATAGMGHFQDMNQVKLAEPLCRFARVIDHPERIVQIVEEALGAATGGAPGPVHLTFPMDVQLAPAAETTAVAPLRRAAARAADDAAEAVAAALKASEKPVVVAGSGVFYADRRGEMVRFCERHHIPVITPIWDRGAVDHASPVFVGVAGAATGGPAVLHEADCILMAGAATDYRVGYLQPPAVRADARVLFFERNWSLLGEACGSGWSSAWQGWLADCAGRRDEFRRQVEMRAEEQARRGLHAIDVIHAIETVLTADPLLLFDGGSIGQWAHQLLCSNRYPGHWLTCGRSGVVGWGIGGAMAARLAYPERPVILLSGDGAFTFNVADLECAARQGLGFVAIVVDDLGWGITRTGHIRQFGEPIASSLGPIAFDQLACSLGAHGVRATEPSRILEELRVAMERPEVTVIHVPVVGGNP